MALEYGTGWGRTRHVLRDSRYDGKMGVCGAAINEKATPEEIAAKPLCKACGRARHINPCTRCGGTGQEPGAAHDRSHEGPDVP